MTDDRTPRRQWTTRRAAVVILALLAVVPFARYAMKDLNTENNVANWLPADDPHAMVLDWYSQEFGLDHGLLASWQGSTLNDPRVEAFAAALAGPLDENGERTQLLEGIAEVRTPREIIRRMVENNVPRDVAIERSAGLLVGTGPLKVRVTAAGQADPQATTDLVVSAAADG